MDDIIVMDMLSGRLPECNIYVGAEFVIDHYSHANELKNGAAAEAIKEAESALESLDDLISENERIRTSKGIIDQLSNVRSLSHSGRHKLAASQQSISATLKQRLKKQPELEKGESVRILQELMRRIAAQVSSDPSDEALELGAQTLASALIENKDTVLMSRSNDLIETIQATYFLLTQPDSPLCLVYPEILQDRLYLGSTVKHTTEMFGQTVSNIGKPVKYEFKKPDKEYDLSEYIDVNPEKEAEEEPEDGTDSTSLQDLRDQLEYALTIDRVAYVDMVNARLATELETRENLCGQISTKAGETNRYRIEVAEAKAEAARLNEELEAARAKYEDRILVLKAQLGDSQRRVGRIGEERNALDEQMFNLQKDVEAEQGKVWRAGQEHKKQIAALTAEHERAIAEAEQRQQDSTSQAAIYQIEKDLHYRICEELRAELAIMRHALETADDALTFSKETNTAGGVLLTNSQADLTSAREEISGLQEQLEEIRGESKELQTRLKELQPEYKFPTEYRTHDEEDLPEVNIGLTLKGKYMEVHLPFRSARGEFNKALAEAVRASMFLEEDELDNYCFECVLPYEEYIGERAEDLMDELRERGQKAKIVLQVNDLR